MIGELSMSLVWSCDGVGLDLRKREVSVKKEQMNTGSRKNTWAFISTPSGLMATATSLANLEVSMDPGIL
jgi:hypothetical protein